MEPQAAESFFGAARSSVEGSWKRLPVWLEENRKQMVAIIVILKASAHIEQGLGKMSDRRNEQNDLLTLSYGHCEQ